MIMEQKKKVSAAVIIYDPVTSSILASHATGAKFKFDDGTPATGCWGLLKGEIDPGEDKKEAAIREVFEESGIELNPDEVEYIGYYYYNDYDNLDPSKFKVLDFACHTKISQLSRRRDRSKVPEYFLPFLEN